MIGVRQVAHPLLRLRSAAPKLHQIPRSFLRPSRPVSTLPPQEPPKKLSLWRRSIWLRRFVYVGLFSGIGAGSGSLIMHIIAAPLQPPGSPLDLEMLSAIEEFYDQLKGVKELRDNPDYTEAPVYGNYSPEDREERLTSGPLRGSSGLALQRVFWNPNEKSAVNVVFLGKGMVGWPKVIHGGAIATVLDEHLARVAIQHLPERTAVTANLDIDYRTPAISDNYFFIHATLDEERSTDRKAYVKGEVRSEFGEVVAEATGLFVVPRGYKLQKLGDGY